jgi:uncharacterized protein
VAKKEASMTISVNLEQLEDRDVHLVGELSPNVLDLKLDSENGLIHTASTLKYQLQVEHVDGNLIVQGQLEIDFDGDCARCLKPFTHNMKFLRWNCVLPLKGPDATEVIGEHVDLTPWVREDILLGLPQHPLCSSACRGLILQQNELPKTDVDKPSADWSKLDEWK